MRRESSDESQARRAAFNTPASGKANLSGENELVDSVASGRMKLADTPKPSLPASLQAMSPKEQEHFVAEKKKERDALAKNIQELAEQRNGYLRQKVEADGGKKDSIDTLIFGSIREQAKVKGLVYKADSAKY